MSREFVTKSRRFFCLSLSPDICKTPRGPSTPAIPYVIKGEFEEATGVSPNVRSNGEPMALADSTVIPTVTGDEAGTAGGTTSGTYGKRVQHNGKSGSVSFNGQRAIRAGDVVWMNDKNTTGKIYLRGGEAPKSASTPPSAAEQTFDQQFDAAISSDDGAQRISPALLALEPGCGSAAIAAATAADTVAGAASPAIPPSPAGADGGTSTGKVREKSDKPPSCGPAAAAPGGLAVSSHHPVHFGTGEEVLEQTDFIIDGELPIIWTRCYRSGSECEDWGPLGARWACEFTTSLSVTDKGIVYHDASGRAICLPPLPAGQSHDSRKEGFVLERADADHFTLTWRSGGIHAFVREKDGWLPHGYDGVNAMRHPGRPARAQRFFLRRSAARDGRGMTIERLKAAQPGAVLLRIRGDDGHVIEAMRAQNDGAMAAAHEADDAPRIGQVDEVRADGSRVCHVRYLYEAETPPHQHPSSPVVDFDDLPRRHNLVSQCNRLGDTRRYHYRHHLLSGFTNYGGFEHGLQWISLGALRKRWTGSALTDAQLAFLYPITTANSYQARATATLTADGKDQVTIAYLDEETSLVTQADGRVFDYRFDANWRATDVRLLLQDRPPQSLGRREWDHDGMLLAETDGIGHTTRYAYDEAGRLAGVTDPLGHASRIEYDSSNQPAAVTDALGHTSRYAYDAAGRLLTMTDAVGQSTQWRYDAAGRLVEVTDTKSGRKQLTYENGRIVRYADCSGFATCYAYDADGRLSEVTDALAQQSRFEYDALGRPVRTIASDGACESAVYDADGNLLSHRDPAGYETRYRYNGHGLPVERIDALGRTIVYRYDSALRLCEIVNANGDSHRFAYGADGLLSAETSFDGKTSTYGYDKAGLLNSIACAGQKVDLRHDAAGRLETRGGPDGVVRYAYDALGRLTAATSPQADLRFAYDALGRMVEERSAYFLDHHVQNGVAGDAQRVADASFMLTHRYDELGKRIESTLLDGRRVDTLRYGAGHWHGVQWQGAPLADVERDRLHREKERVLRAGRLSMRASRDYDPQSRLASMTVDGGSRAGALRRAYAYDAAGNLTRIIQSGRSAVPGGLTQHETIRYHYNRLGQLLGADRLGLTERFAFDPAGNLLDPDSGAITSSTRVRGNLLRQFGKVSYEYDDHGNVVNRCVRARSGEIETALALSYDADNRIVKAVRTDGATVETAFYFYDAFSRRIAKQVSRAKIDAANPTLETTLFVWDADTMVQEIVPGKTTSHVYEPDSFIPLARVEVENDHTIDLTTGRWVMGAVSGASTLMGGPCGEQSSMETRQSLSGALEKTDKAIRPDDRIYFYQCDHLGTPLKLIDTDGHVVWAAKQCAWGKIFDVAVEKIPQAIRFQGQYEDTETGLYYNRHRYYDPITARYLQSDPIGLAGGLNARTYADGNSISHTDPTGQYVIYIVLGLIGASAGAIGSYVNQRFIQGNCSVDWGQVGNAAIWGAIAGIALPYASSLARVAVLGGATGGLQYISGQLISGQKVTGKGFGTSIAIGAIAGAIGGKFSPSPWYGSVGTALPKLAAKEQGLHTLVANAGTSSMLRNLAAGVIGGFDPAASNNQCCTCKK